MEGIDRFPALQRAYHPGPGAPRGWCDRPLLGSDDGLHGGLDAAGDLDLDQVCAGLADRLVEVNLLLLYREAAGGLDRVGDLRRGDGAEELAVFSRAVVDRQNRLRGQGGRRGGGLE